MLSGCSEIELPNPPNSTFAPHIAPVVDLLMIHRLGRLRDRAIEAQQYRASGFALATAAIALWNTVYLDRAIDALRRGAAAAK
jgi:hypothetical protein